jgi:hypothetical protein
MLFITSSQRCKLRAAQQVRSARHASSPSPGGRGSGRRSEHVDAAGLHQQAVRTGRHAPVPTAVRAASVDMHRGTASGGSGVPRSIRLVGRHAPTRQRRQRGPGAAVADAARDEGSVAVGGGGGVRQLRSRWVVGRLRSILVVLWCSTVVCSASCAERANANERERARASFIIQPQSRAATK